MQKKKEKGEYGYRTTNRRMRLMITGILLLAILAQLFEQLTSLDQIDRTQCLAVCFIRCFQQSSCSFVQLSHFSITVTDSSQNGRAHQLVFSAEFIQIFHCKGSGHLISVSVVDRIYQFRENILFLHIYPTVHSRYLHKHWPNYQQRFH